jgi:hypothetical protein
MKWEKTRTNKRRCHGNEHEYLHKKWESKKRISRVEETINCPTNAWNWEIKIFPSKVICFLDYGRSASVLRLKGGEAATVWGGIERTHLCPVERENSSFYRIQCIRCKHFRVIPFLCKNLTADFFWGRSVLPTFYSCCTILLVTKRKDALLRQPKFL